MKRFCLFLLMVLLLSLVPAGSVMAQAYTETTVEKIPLDRVVDIPCANEQVRLEGTLLVVTHMTFAGNNPPNFVIHSVRNPQGITGTGSVSGDRYQGTGVSIRIRSSNVADDGFPYVETWIDNFRIVGQGPGNNYLVHYLYHITVDNNEVVRSYIDSFSVECK